MRTRSDSYMECIVTKGIETSVRGDLFSAYDFLVENAVPLNVINRVLNQQEQIRMLDIMTFKGSINQKLQ